MGGRDLISILDVVGFGEGYWITLVPIRAGSARQFSRSMQHVIVFGVLV